MGHTGPNRGNPCQLSERGLPEGLFREGRALTDISTTTESYDTLTPDEMRERNEARIQSLANQGFVVNRGTGYLEIMLEVLLGDRLDEARMTYQKKLGAELDGLESQVLRMRLGIV